MNKVIGIDWSGTNSSGFQACLKCGKPYWEVYPSTGGTCRCAFVTPPVSPKQPKQGGWICPACGCGNASWSSKCGHCKPKPVQLGSESTEIW